MVGVPLAWASTVSSLPSHNPAHIFFSGRNKTRADELISKTSKHSPSTKITFIECDLASLTSVQSAAKQVLSLTNRLDVLICNAGIMATPTELSKDGYELQFATNHLGHALLMKVLLPLMLETAAQPMIRRGRLLRRRGTRLTGLITSRALAKKLWEWTEKELNDWN
ncbi:Oxidoreductase [Pyrenophora teres f. teres]|uniref:Oxidoreductase n=1 Tax=Pyrenophora teres f. teres TaxID=97479 RepID=A0A6S6VWX1_9PLEO|nr:Oxidoreductase [Pyrenophora teres f. teres]